MGVFFFLRLNIWFFFIKKFKFNFYN